MPRLHRERVVSVFESQLLAIGTGVLLPRTAQNDGSWAEEYILGAESASVPPERVACNAVARRLHKWPVDRKEHGDREMVMKQQPPRWAEDGKAGPEKWMSRLARADTGISPSGENRERLQTGDTSLL
jgi:hypothetical protein